jgi:hypothetical protein
MMDGDKSNQSNIVSSYETTRGAKQFGSVEIEVKCLLGVRIPP